MKILQVIPYFSPRMGGVAQVVFRLASHLAGRGHQVTVLAGDYKLDEVSFPNTGFKQIILHNLSSHWGFYFTPSLITWGTRSLKDYDLIHFHEVRTFQNAVISQFAIRSRIPYLVSAHGTLPVIMHRKVAKRCFDYLIGRRFLKEANCLIAVSPIEVDQYLREEIAPEKIRLIPNGIDLEEFSLLPPRGIFRQKLGIPEGSSIVLYFGRLHRIKRIDLLIKAFAEIPARFSDIYLVIAGPDEGEQANLERMASNLELNDRTRFTGPLYGEEKLALMVDADVLVSPGLYEIFGLVPLESLMCGTPVVASTESGAGRLLADSHAGYLFQGGNVQSLAGTLNRALKHPDEAAAKVMMGQRYIQHQLSWDNIVERVEQAYRWVIQSGCESVD